MQPTHGRVQGRVGAALHQPHQADLRERPLPAAACGPAERRHVGGRVRHVQGGPVQRDQPPPAIPRPLGRWGRQRPGDLREQRPQRRRPQPGPGAGDRALVGDLPAALPASGPRQALDQQPHDLLVAGLGNQAHGQGVVDHHAGGQQPPALLAPPGPLDHPIDQLGREALGQHPDRDPIRQAGRDRWLGLSSSWHPGVITSGRRTLPDRQPPNPTALGQSHAPRPQEDWIAVAVPQIVAEETFARVQAKLDTNQQTAARNTRHEYLLRALVSCGVCQLSCTLRRTQAGYRYYLCRGRTDALRVAQGQRCGARYIPAGQLDELVWADLCALLADPAQVSHALQRARGGAWLPQQLQARQATIRQALGQLERQQQRLLDAYLAEVVGLAELDRKRQELDRRRATLAAQQRQLDAVAEQRLELRAVADGIEAFCQTVHAGLATATFAQRRLLVELLIDRVVVTDGEVEIRYVLPTSPDGPHPPFCQLRKDHLGPPASIQSVRGLVVFGLTSGVDGPLDQPRCPLPPRGLQPLHLQVDLICPLGEGPQQLLGHALEFAVPMGVRSCPLDPERPGQLPLIDGPVDGVRC